MKPDLVVYFIPLPDWIKDGLFIPTRLYGAKDWFSNSAHAALLSELERTVAVAASWTDDDNDYWVKRGYPLDSLVVITKPETTMKQVTEIVDSFEPGLYGALNDYSDITYHLVSHLSYDAEGVIRGYYVNGQWQALEKRGISYVFMT